MKAVLMAGGKGTRLRPLTDHMCKPMMPIIDKPILEYIISHVKSYGIYEVAMTLGYRPDDVTRHFGDGSKFGVKIEYFVETVPLGTAGGVKNAVGNCRDDVLVMSGDAFTNLDLSKLTNAHKSSGALVTMALKAVDDARGFGLAQLDADGFVGAFKEKPLLPVSGLVNMGVYVVSTKALKMIPDGVPCDFAKDLFPRIMRRIKGVPFDCYWSDIGTLPSYYATNRDVAMNPKAFGFAF